jgi:phage FluMu protein Com
MSKRKNKIKDKKCKDKPMILKPRNYYNFNYAGVNKKFGPGLTFLGTIPIKNKKNDTYVPWAVYQRKKPIVDKYPEFLLLCQHNGHVYVNGRMMKEILKDRYHKGIYCEKCKTVLASIDTHDFIECRCKPDDRVFADGGKEYIHCSKTSHSRVVKIDMLNKIKL